MDLARSAAARRALICAWALLFSLTFNFDGQAQVGASPADESAKQLLAEKQWQQVVQLAESASSRSADLDFYYGSALAQLQRWSEAHRAFQAGAALQPRDPRFLIELAGVDFKQKHFSETVSHLRRALRLAPGDAYALDFLATTYFLQGNQEAAVKYWNPLGRPNLAAVRFDPTPRINPALLDRAFAFAPQSVLRLDDLLDSEARVEGLGIFSSFNFETQARADGGFDLVFHNHENNGFGPSKIGAIIRLFRGLPGQTVYPEYFNFHSQAINFTSMYRWDAEKRRVLVELSSPWRHNPKRRVTLGPDLRGENWDIRSSFRNTAPLLGGFNLRREAFRAEISTLESWRWNWTAGGEVSHRDFRDINFGSVLTPSLLAKGYQLKQTAALNFQVLHLPEERLTLSARGSSDAGRLWSTPSQSFERLQGSLRLHWLPQAVGDDYEVHQELRAGKTWGNLPFDELSVFGGLGDSDLMMRGHITTRRGRKGSGPLGRNYFLSNSEIDKNIFHDAWVAVKLGPFLDTGKITDPLPGLGSRQWLWDTGAQIKVRAFGFGVAFSYGKDLRSGNNAVFFRFLGE